MRIKIGDIVLYRGLAVRLMGVHPIRLKLSHFGTVDGTISDLTLIKPTVSPTLNVGDLVIVNNIPQDEKDVYPPCWESFHEDIVKSEIPCEIDAIQDSQHFGLVVKINDMWFLPYHLEPIPNYDMI